MRLVTDASFNEANEQPPHTIKCARLTPQGRAILVSAADKSGVAYNPEELIKRAEHVAENALHYNAGFRTVWVHSATIPAIKLHLRLFTFDYETDDEKTS